MEQGRLFLAIALSLAVFLAWDFFFVDREAMRQAQVPAVQDPQAEGPAREKTAAPPPERAVLTPRESGGADVEEPAVPAAPPSREITVNTPLYRVRISERGAVIRSFVLHNYRESAEKGSPSLEMISPRIPEGILGVGFGSPRLAGAETAPFSLDGDREHLEVATGEETLTFTWQAPEGIEVRKTFRFSADSYLIGLGVDLENRSASDLVSNLTVGLRAEMQADDARIGFVGAGALLDDNVEQVKPGDIVEKTPLKGRVDWFTIQDRYFLMSLITESETEGRIDLTLDDESLVGGRYAAAAETVPGGRGQKAQMQVYLGPKSLRILSDVGHRLDEAIDFGWFDIIARPCLWFMNFIYGFIPNYGIAIIILTLVTKLLLWPLGTKSYKSMSEMKKIQPLMTEIREKYKDDKKKMNEELMGLYRIYKINPLGGCLPMVVQIPVFIALYRMLYESIELRHAPFFGWITDLSAPDRLLDFGFSIPFMEPPYGIPVLTLVMGASMFLQQKMSPPMGDPTQAKMMMFMPIIFTFIFINFSSGLVLYWLINNLFSIGQQYYITRKYA